MRSLIMYDEFGPGMGLPSMKKDFCKETYPGQSRIVKYLREGRATYAAAGYARDVIAGETLPVALYGMTDGEYSWNSALSYYVERYNLRLPNTFERKVLGRPQ